MTVVEAMRESHSDWLSKRPWLALVAMMLLAVLVGIGIGQAWRNADVIGNQVGAAHWRYTHQLGGERPAKVAPEKKN